MRKIFSFLIFGLILYSCEKDETIVNPGKFELRIISIDEAESRYAPKVTSLQGSYSQDVNEVFLDTIKASTSFYFMLGNLGESDITDVAIRSDNPYFNISPLSAPLISGISGDRIFNQVFSIDVVHGERINGIGSTDFLKKGINSCNLSIKGKTFDGESKTSVSINAKITVFAEIMSIDLFQGRYEYDLNSRDFTMSAYDGRYMADRLNSFYYFTINPPLTIRNTGNVNIKMTMRSFDSGLPVIQTTSIQPNDTINLLLPFGDEENGDGGWIRLDSEGTVFDIDRLSLGRDDAAYLALKYPSAFWLRNHLPPDRIY